MTEKDFEDLFTSIVKQCIEKDIVKTRRYIVDSTNVDANTNYPSDKQLLRQAYTNVSKELSKQNEIYASTWLQTVEQSIELLYDGEEKVPAMKHYEIVQKALEEIYINTHDSMDLYPKYARAFGVCYMLIDKYINGKKDKIISIVDPDARVAHKSKGKCKTGYKNHIIVDEDSEIILSSTQTPFNVGDQNELLPLVEQVMYDYQDYGIKPDEISADKAYGTTIIRAELKDEGIICNVDFYDDKEENDEPNNNRYKTSDFVFLEDITQARCPMGLTTDRYDDLDGYGDVPMREFIFDASQCDKCSERDRCLRVKDGKIVSRIKRIRVSSRYDVILHDKEYNKTEAFKTARDKRYKVERRFATMVNHRGMRRSRYIGISGAIRHIITGNTVTNIIRAVRVIDSLKICAP